MSDDHSPCLLLPITYYLYYMPQVFSSSLHRRIDFLFFTYTCTENMSSLLQSFQSKEALPMSQPTEEERGEGLGVRKRLSSLSLRMNMRMRSTCQKQPILSFYSSSTTSSSSSWAFRRSKSLSSMGEYTGNSIRKWWDWGLGWIMSKKPAFANDLEMNEEEKAVLGCNSKGSWRHVFYKVRSELRRFIGSGNNVGLPQTFRYDSFNYSNNFDDNLIRNN